MNSNFIYREIQLLVVAIRFLTRLPAPHCMEFFPEQMDACARYYPLVGVIVGAITALAYMLFTQVFPLPLSVVLSMAVSVLVTGAFHEDGFADCCDGFGAGWDRSEILRIMKDSCIGSYGALGLGLMLSSKFIALCAYPSQSIAFILVLAHGFSRLIAVSLLYDYQYVQEDTLSKVKPLAKQLKAKALLFSVLSVLPLLLGVSFKQAVFLIVGLVVVRFLAGQYLKKRLGGYTGDCLGAVQQLAELFIYLLLIVVD